MKKLLLTCCLLAGLLIGHAQTTYYWVGGAGPASFTANANWNTMLDGSGTARTAAAATDILVFNGSNIGGATPATGTVTVTVTSTNFAQLKLTGSASVNVQRPAGGGGTGTLTVNGSAGDDLVIDAGSTLRINSALADGNVVITFSAAATGLVSGALMISNTGANRFTLPTAGALVFASGSGFTTNLNGTTAVYPFGSATQSAEKAVVFQSGASLYYEGGYSPMGNTQAFSAIDFRPGSNWYHRATNPTSGSGSFFNTKSFGNIIVENSVTLAADGPVYRIENLTVNAGSTFITHSSGQTVVLGNLTVNGTLTAQATQRSNVLVMGGTGQTISGSGTIAVPSFTVANNATVTLAKSLGALDSTVNIYGQLDFGTSQLAGAGTFTSRVNATATGVSGTVTAGAYQVTAVSGTMANLAGLTVTGNGIAPNTSVVGFSGSNATINLSKPALTSGTAVALSFYSDTALLMTANPNGFDSTNGSVIVINTKNYQSGTNYVFNAATAKPFGMTSGTTATHINAGRVTFNAPVTTNTGATIFSVLQLNNAVVTIRSIDTVRLAAGAQLAGSFSATNYFATDVSGANIGLLRRDALTLATLFPVGTATAYLPATLTPSSASDYTVGVFQGITEDGQPNGTALSAAQKQTKVDAVWQVNRVSGSGSAQLDLSWTQSLEGSTFTTWPDSDIGIIMNQNPGWNLPAVAGNNTANTASLTISGSGAFSVGAKPPAQPFVFNPLPVKTYGNADFTAGVVSMNTSQPITYTSSNPLVATIVGQSIHITGTGTTDITASQPTDGFYPAASVTQTLTVQKAPLTIKADDKAKPEGDPNPALTVTYTGFVNGENAGVLLTPVTLSTTATTSSPAGTYPIIPAGATATNYQITFVNGTLTVTPRQNQTITFNALPAKTYGNADFQAGATSTNGTIPITYTSSDPAVATVSGSTIHIVGAGTATITASQAGNAFYFPAADVTRTLTVSKANLTVRVRDTSRLQGTANPPFTITYTGFVLGQGASALTVAPVATTPADINSIPGYYPINLEGGVSPNYNFIYVPGRLTVLPATGSGESNLQVFRTGSYTLTVRMYAPAPDLGDIVIMDMVGRPLLRRNVFLAQGFMNYSLNTIGLPAGKYIVSVQGKTTNLRSTIIIIP